MKNFLIALANHIESEVATMARVDIGILPTTVKGLAIRQGPAPQGARYMNRSGIKNVMVQVLGKSTVQGEVIDQMDLITQALDLSSGELTVTGYDFIKCEVYTEPNFVEVTSNKEYIYTALFRAELIKRG